MGEHYYTANPTSEHSPRHFSITYRGRCLQFETDAGVFSRDHLDRGTALLLDCLPETFAGRALDLGCGWGAIGACMAAQWPGAEIVMTDINERAAILSRENLRRNRLAASVFHGDGLAHLPGNFDLIATNPPIRAGKQALYTLLQAGVQRLAPGGALLLVIGKKQGADSAKRYLQTIAPHVDTVGRGGGFHVLRVYNDHST